MTTSMVYDTLSRLVSRTEAVGKDEMRTTTMAYDAANNATKVTEPQERVTSTSYDALNRVGTITEAVGKPEQRSSVTLYDAAGNVLSRTVGLAPNSDYARPLTTSYAYDALNQRTATIEAFNVAELKRTTTVSYDAAGNVTLSTDALGRDTRFGYDPLNRRTSVTEAANKAEKRTTTTSYDTQDNVVLVTKPNGFGTITTAFSYDALNRQRALIEALGIAKFQRTTLYNYDAAGNLVEQITPRAYDNPEGWQPQGGFTPSDPESLHTRFSYDALNQRTLVVEAYGVDEANLGHQSPVTTTMYDAVGNVTDVIDPLGRRTHFEYDYLNRQIAIYENYSIVGFNGTVFPWYSRKSETKYDLLDNVTTITHASGVDNTFAQRSVTDRFEYDLLGRQIKAIIAFEASSADGIQALRITTTSSYDAADHLTEVITPLPAGLQQINGQDPGVYTKHEYDALGRRTATIEAVGRDVKRTTKFEYDKADRLVAKIAPKAYDSEIAALPPNERNNPELAVRTSYTYDNLDRVTLTLEALGATKAERSITQQFDTADRLILTNTAGLSKTRYRYDPLGRQTAAVEAADSKLQRTTFRVYDAADNLRSEVRSRLYDSSAGPVWISLLTGSFSTAALALLSNWSHLSETRNGYDVLNRRVSQTLAANAWQISLGHAPPRTEWKYDAAGRNVETTGPIVESVDLDGNVERWRAVTKSEYDALGNLTKTREGTVTTGANAQPVWLRDAVMSYDCDGRIVERTTALDATLGSGAWMTEEASMTTFAYDAAGRTTGMSEGLNPLGWTASHESRWTLWLYDSAGNVYQEMRGEYRDGLQFGREPSEASLNFVSNTQYEYDALSRRVTMVAAFASTELQNKNTELLGGYQSPLSVFKYDAANNLTGMINSRGVGTSYAYDALNRQTLATEAATTPSTLSIPAESTEKEYDALGRLTSVKTPTQLKTQYEYDKLGRQTRILEAQGSDKWRQTTSTFDAQDNLTTQTRGAGGTGAHPITTGFRYDALNRQTTAIALADLSDTAAREALQHARPVTRIKYDARGLVVQASDLVGGVKTAAATERSTRYFYDRLGRQTQVVTGTIGEHRLEQAVYDLAGNKVFSLDGRGVETWYLYDRLNRRISTIQHPFEELPTLATHVKYNHLDRVTEQTSPLGTTTYDYDRLGRQRAIHEPNGHEVNFTYDSAGNQLTLADGGGQKPGTTTFAYDALNRRTQETNPRNVASKTGYDPSKRLVKITTREGEVIRRTFDILGRLQEESWDNQKGKTVYTKQFEYNLLDELIVSSVTRNELQQALIADFAKGNASAKSLRHEMKYDKLGRLREDINAKGEIVTISYDAGSRRIHVLDFLNGDDSSTYDSANRLLTRKLRKGSGTAEITALDVSWNYEPPLAGEAGGGINLNLHEKDPHLDLVYRVEKRDPSKKVQSGINEAYTYDALGRIRKIAVSLAENSVSNVDTVSYKYHSNGLLHHTIRDPRKKNDKYRIITQYDKVGQVELEEFYHTPLRPNDPPLFRPEYDAQGNRREAGTGYNAGNQLAVDNRADYKYDKNGNLTLEEEKSTTNAAWTFTADTTYEYDPTGQLIAAVATKTSSAEDNHGDKIGTIEKGEVWYLYDAEGRLIYRKTRETHTKTEREQIEDPRPKTDTTSTTSSRTYAHLDQEVWAETSGTFAQRYLRGIGVDQLLAGQQRSGDKVIRAYWHVTDTQGSVLDNLSLDGTRYYAALGYRTSSPFAIDGGKNAATLDSYEYTGRSIDTITGLRNHRARWFNPRIGRWMSEDPLGFRAGDTNLYRYAGNSWPNASDPSGKIIATVAGAIIGGVAGGLTGDGWSWERFAAGAASGAMIGAGVDLMLSGVGAVAGAGLLAAGSASFVAGLGTANKRDRVDWGAWGKSAIVGGASGVAGGAVGLYAGAAFGTSLGGMAATGFLSAAASDATSQVLGLALGTQEGGYDIGRTLFAGLGGAVGGGITGGLMRGTTFGQEAGKLAGLLKCAEVGGISRNSLLLRHAIGGGMGGMLGDAGMQGYEMLSGHRTEWDWTQMIGAGANGAVLSVAAGIAQWRYHRACFAAGTPIRTPDGSKPIEQIKAGDLVLSRDENDPQGEVLPKLVEETFVTESWIIELHIGGQLIRTTIEHPFFVHGQGWTAAGLLCPGDLLSCEDGGWLRLDDVSDTAEYETVFNLKVSVFSTYFVGSESWCFSVWAHNSYKKIQNSLSGVVDDTTINELINTLKGIKDAPVRKSVVNMLAGLAEGGELALLLDAGGVHPKEIVKRLNLPTTDDRRDAGLLLRTEAIALDPKRAYGVENMNLRRDSSGRIAGDIVLRDKAGLKPELGTENNPHNTESYRELGVQRAWQDEMKLIGNGQLGTADWTPAQRRRIKEMHDLLQGKISEAASSFTVEELDAIKAKNGFMVVGSGSNGEVLAGDYGFTGHHLNSVESHPQWAADRRNIAFLQQGPVESYPMGHMALGHPNGGTTGSKYLPGTKLIDRPEMLSVAGVP